MVALKFIPVSFFKNIGFSTKKEGIRFINSNDIKIRDVDLEELEDNIKRVRRDIALCPTRLKLCMKKLPKKKKPRMDIIKFEEEIPEIKRVRPPNYAMGVQKIFQDIVVAGKLHEKENLNDVENIILLAATMRKPTTNTMQNALLAISKEDIQGNDPGEYDPLIGDLMIERGLYDPSGKYY